MPILPPSLDDRSYEDLVAELVARIPAHTPEWTNPTPGDPGRTLLELFAWLTDTLLYRANLIPERQRLAFLRLVGVPLRAAVAARGVVTVTLDDDKAVEPVMLSAGAIVNGPVPFETQRELTILPITAEAYYKRPLTTSEKQQLGPVVDGLREIYKLTGPATPYVSAQAFPNSAPELGGFDLITRTVDKCLWLALLAPNAATRSAVRDALGSTTPTGAPRVLSVGFNPQFAVPALFDEIGPRPSIPHVWEISGLTAKGEPRYIKLDVLTDKDSTRGLTRRGVIPLVLPTIDKSADTNGSGVRIIAAPSNDLRQSLEAGVGDRPPRIDDPKKAARLVAWLRLRPTTKQSEFMLSWLGVNAVEIDQRQTANARIVGQSDGSADQVMALPGRSVEPESLVIQVEEEGKGFVLWRRIDDLALAGRDAVYTLDAEAGTIRFGDGVRGRIPDTGRRVRVDRMRAGGGRAGNLPPGSLARMSRMRSPEGAQINPKVKIAQPLPTDGGEDAENLADAERRIPSLFRDRDRAVTTEDYRRIAADTPGVRIGRVEIMPRFKPQQRADQVPGVVTVLTLPFKEGFMPPAPRPDRPFLEAVHAYLDARRVLTTELYVIGCEYVPLGAGVAISVRDGFGRDAVLQGVRDALHMFLWSLAPGGHDHIGWTLGRSVSDREIEVAIARVPGVAQVNGVALFRERVANWERIQPPRDGLPAVLSLERWQLPELLSVVVLDGLDVPTDLRGVPNPFAVDSGIPVPVIPEVC